MLVEKGGRRDSPLPPFLKRRFEGFAEQVGDAEDVFLRLPQVGEEFIVDRGGPDLPGELLAAGQVDDLMAALGKLNRVVDGAPCGRRLAGAFALIGG